MVRRTPSGVDESHPQDPEQANELRHRLTEPALVAGAALVQVGGTAMAAQNQPDHGSLGVGAALLLALGVVALPARHRFPVGVLGFTFCTTLAYWSLDNPGGPVFVSLIIALIQAVLVGRRRAAITSVVAGFVAFPWLPYLLGNAERPTWAALVALAAWLAVLISLGEVIRSRRDRAREAARSAAEALRRQAADERLGIARDLHDSVAHNLSLISIQAGVAEHLMDEGRSTDGGDDGVPEQVREALDAIKRASKDALVELRSILGVLRHADEVEPQTSGGDHRTAPNLEAAQLEDTTRRGDAPRTPVPDLQRLREVVERASSTGLDVRVEMDIDRATLQALPRQVGVAAFRIVQESLTNVVRHSDSASAVVRIGIPDDDVMSVEVLDEGSGKDRPDRQMARRRLADRGGDGAADRPAARDRAAESARHLPGGGNGIAGMRERAAAAGGWLEAGPRSGRGFAVRAALPLEPGLGDPA